MIPSAENPPASSSSVPTTSSGTVSTNAGAIGATTNTTTAARANSGATDAVEEDLRRQLRSLSQSLKRREPLKPTYKHLITDGIVTSRKPSLPKDKFYRRIGSRLRFTVERFATEMQGKDPFDKIAQRQPLEEEKMRAALTLREFKEHEQTPLLEATLAAVMSTRSSTRPGGPVMDEMTRRRYLDGVALGLQSSRKPRKLLPLLANPNMANMSSSSTKDKQMAELDLKRQEAKQREEARQQKQELEDENKRRQRQEESSSPSSSFNSRGKKSSAAAATPPQPPETPQQALHKFYQPIFKLLWDMEFAYLGNTNPFRMVIDRENCAAVGAPDYCDIIEKPMNLTYIQRRVDDMSYVALSDFFQDVDLMLQNAIKYNSDPQNPYRVAAEEMQKRYKRAAKKIVQAIEKKYGNNKGASSSS